MNNRIINRLKSGIAAGACRRLLVLFLLSLCLLTAGGCESKEAVLLETEDLVYEEPEPAKEDGQEEREAESAAKEQMEEAHLFVHMCGAVLNPGVYELEQGSRIFEAVEAAGGFREDACENYVNMALQLEDGWKIVIPTVEESEAMLAAGDTSEVAFLYDLPDGAVISGSGKKEAENGLVNINTASREELCSLPGIGASRADSIITYREKSGGFAKPEDIMQVEGIKEGMFSKLKDKICVK